VVLDVPLLVEAGQGVYSWDRLVVVTATQRTILRRLKKRSGWSASQVRTRQACQLPLQAKKRLADFVVKNDGTWAVTRRQVARIWKQLDKESIHECKNSREGVTGSRTRIQASFGKQAVPGR